MTRSPAGACETEFNDGNIEETPMQQEVQTLFIVPEASPPFQMMRRQAGAWETWSKDGSSEETSVQWEVHVPLTEPAAATPPSQRTRSLDGAWDTESNNGNSEKNTDAPENPEASYNAGSHSHFFPGDKQPCWSLED
ncbi:hypothetical protein NDU88_005849 [Pleurodeles waltl]|uniref:Uncharacterized protein n=1 Tax=Pleurodeles waltl TaxID=8319 RepID=A0AAV7WZT5_PLEWA|nr:hypothetical protein NDU88_005849 [Pleurodeles waltl]